MTLEILVAYPLTKWLLEKAGEKVVEQVFKKNKATSIDEKFKVALIKTCKTLQFRYPTAFGGSIETFFSNKEILEEIYRLVFRYSRFSTSELSQKIDLSTLPPNFIIEFVTELRQNCMLDTELERILSNKQLFVAIIGIGANAEAIEKNTTLTLIEITSIKEILEKTFNKEFSLEAFLERYRKSALRSFSELNFIGLGIKSYIKKNRKKLFDIYVHPRFTYKIADLDSHHRQLPNGENALANDPHMIAPVNLNKIFEFKRNLVILGAPGSGKSVLVKYLICKILEGNSHLIPDDLKSAIPFRIELRKYLQYKKETRNGLVNYLSQSFETDFGLINLSTENILKIFDNNSVIIFFDGLDEIFNSTDKIEIKNDIENIVDSCSNMLAVVTSRFIGYDEAKLDKDKFIELTISSFNDAQVKEYAEKWYSQEEVSNDLRSKEVAEFLKAQGSIDKELTRNPLLLSLIVILFRNNLRLPESKLEIYQSCTKTLVEKWDQMKELKIDLDEELAKRKETLFADLAFWQYEMLSGDNKIITHEAAINQITDSIVNKLKITDDWISAKRYAEEFMNYAQKRSLYFDNNFTHKTFLEYYTAYWIYSNVEKKHKKENRDNIIEKYVHNSFWVIVLELLINMIDQDQPDNDIIDELYEVQLSRRIESVNLLLAVTNSVKNISSKTVYSLLTKTLYFLCKDHSSEKENLRMNYFSTLGIFLLHKTHSIIFENALIDFRKKYQSDDRTYFRVLALYLELCVSTSTLAYNNKVFEGSDEFSSVLEKSSYLYFVWRQLTQPNFGSSVTDIEEILNRFGEEAVYKDYDSVYGQFGYMSVLGGLLYWNLKPQNIETLSENLEKLLFIGLERQRFLQYLKSEFYFGIVQDESVESLAVHLAHANSTTLELLTAILWKIKSASGPFRKGRFDKMILDDKVKRALDIVDFDEFLNAISIKNEN